MKPREKIINRRNLTVPVAKGLQRCLICTGQSFSRTASIK